MPDEEESDATSTPEAVATDEDDLLSGAEAAARLGVTPRDLERLRRQGAVEAVSERSGWRRAWRYRRASVEAYLRVEQKAGGEPRPGGAKTASEMFAELMGEFPFPPEARDEYPAADESPLVRLANALLANAIDLGASHLYIEPRHRRHGVGVRFRIDGILREVMPLPPHVYGPLLNRYKVMADLPAEASAPQTGHIPIKHNGADYRLRVDTIPSRYGESIAIAIQDENRWYGLSKLGIHPGTQDAYEHLLVRPSGLILVAGAAGQGTTTTLYNTLHKINSVQSKIVVLTATGDPTLSGITQIPPADAGKGEAERVARGALAQRPDVLAFSEIRDAETMGLALDAVEDGIRVIGTVRAPFGAVSAIERITDWGIAPTRIARVLNGVLAQRLVRRLCLECRNSYTTTPADAGVDRLAQRFPSVDPEAEAVTLYLAQGCEKCGNTGYRGRAGAFELLQVGESVRSYLGGSRRHAETLADAAEDDGTISLGAYATLLLLNGTTSVDELIRVGLRPPR
ncbi:MAG TPA: ATPase, T2SS/T4P/T4SS family [Armatimonadaceae bacterium]|nr:ATPase, T2SS/T4P/T4SS family [Armatimonadaceae bacterium]